MRARPDLNEPDTSHATIAGNEKIQEDQVEIVISLDGGEKLVDCGGFYGIKWTAFGAEDMLQHAPHGIAEKRMILGNQNTGHIAPSHLATAALCCTAARDRVELQCM